MGGRQRYNDTHAWWHTGAMQDPARGNSPSSRSTTRAPECVVVTTDGARRVVDLFSRSAERVAALESEDVKAVELRGFRFDKQLSLEQLDRFFASVKASQLQSLVLEDSVLTDRVVTFVVETFVRENTLTALIVRHCRQVSMTSIMALATLVKSAPLITLDLSSCHLARQAGILLGQALQTCRTLKSINVSGNNLRDGGLKAIADGIRAQTQNEPLDEFDFSENGISATGFAAVISVQAKRVVAKDNSITNFPTPVISSNRMLTNLDVSGNAFSDDCMRALFTHAVQSPSLSSLNVQNCHVSQANEEFLTKSLLLKATTTNGSSLRELHIGDKPNIDDLLDDKDGSLELVDRLLEFKRALEARVPGLSVHLLEPFCVGDMQRSEEEEEHAGDGREPSDEAVYDVEPETPGRQLRRELLERTEFMRRHSEELPLADDDESLASFVSGKLMDKCLPSRPASRSTTSTYRGTVDADQDSVCVSHRPSSSFVPPQLHHSVSNASFFISPSLDDVASQFSIDPPPSAMASTLQNTDVELIVARTIETMNRNFEQRLSQFLLRMEYQQQEKNATQLQMLAAKVEACERAIPRLEARLDVLADRIATSGAQVSKMQTDLQTKQTIVSSASANALASTTQLTAAMQSQVEELVASRLRSSESHVQTDIAMLRRDLSAATAATQHANPQAVVDAVSVHLTQFKQEFDSNQSTVLRRFTENIVRDGVRVDERMQQLEGKVAHLEGIIQAEQHASLLALEAISEAFTGNNAPQTAVAPVAPLPPPQPMYTPHHQQQQQQPYVSKPIVPPQGYAQIHR